MSDEEIIALLKSTERDQRRGLRLLYQGKGREFGRYFVRCGMPYANAEEAVQETILKILRHAKDFTGEGTAKAWMWAAARNILIDWKRKQKRNLEDQLSEQEWSRQFDGDETVSNLASSTRALEQDNSSEIENCVSNGIAKFSEDEPERAYVISLHVDGVDGREIAERIGRTYQATRQYLLQCRQKLAPYISGCMQLLEA
jgi:RNA polymerase sigma factor (sigma-70 family)